MSEKPAMLSSTGAPVRLDHTGEKGVLELTLEACMKMLDNPEMTMSVADLFRLLQARTELEREIKYSGLVRREVD